MSSFEKNCYYLPESRTNSVFFSNLILLNFTFSILIVLPKVFFLFLYYYWVVQKKNKIKYYFFFFVRKVIAIFSYTNDPFIIFFFSKITNPFRISQIL
ncbi:hypothetical protein C2G38_2066820, partial [Gigaspora rosea]